MVGDKTREFELRVRSLRKRLALDFQPLRDTLSNGLDVLVDPEAAVLCTATVEALCDALFNVVVKNLHEDAAASLAPLETKVTVYHIHVALRSHADFSQLLQGVESAVAVVEFFLDDATSKALYERQLIATREAKHLRPTATSSSTSTESTEQPLVSDEELIARHERTRSEWQKREDDPFSEVDFATVLKCVHPAFTLAYSATLLLSALVRELLNEVCELADIESVQQRLPPELDVEDLRAPLARVFHVGDTGKHIERTASECLERFRLRSRQGATLSLRFRVFSPGNVQSLKAPLALASVARDAPFAQLLPAMCRKSHVDVASTVGVYRGHQLEPTATPASLSMPSGAVVYLVPTKWWDHTRRNEARRGLLSSLRPQDALVKSLVESSESRVKRDVQRSPPSDARGFGFLGAAASPSAVLRRREHKRKTLPAHTASASRLMGVGREEEEKGEEGFHRSDGEEEDEDEEDSLARLLRQRRREREIAQTSAQLVATMDEAWLGFAGLSASVRALDERLARARGGDDTEDLASELRRRVAEAGALVRQASSAQELLTQLLLGVRRAVPAHAPSMMARR